MRGNCGSPSVERTRIGEIGSLIGAIGVLLLLTSCAPRWQVSPPIPPPSPVLGQSGMVVAAHPLAAEVGVKVLEEGGNAVDAAIATLLALNVVEPYASGLGGGGFALVWFSGQPPRVIIYRERAPADLDISFYYDPADSLKRLRKGATSVAVPGAPLGYAELYARWGSLPLERLVNPAIELAEKGFPLDPLLARLIQDYLPLLASDSLLSATFLKEGLPPSPGDTLHQPLLAQTLRQIAREGFSAFYYGDLGEEVVASIKRRGGSLSEADLRQYRVLVTEPLTIHWRGYQVFTVPPPSMGGLALLEALQLADLVQVSRFPYNDPRFIHLLSQCIAQGMTDAGALVQDPAYMKGSPLHLLHQERLSHLARTISLEGKAKGRAPMLLEHYPNPGNTTHLVIADRWGNVVSITQSINYFFGAGVMAGSTGIILNNQMADFDAPPDTINLVQPRKMPRSFMAPVIVAQNGRPLLVLGTPGGSRIPSTLTQILTYRLMVGMDLVSSVDANRFYPSGTNLILENRIPLESLKKLRRLGYTLHLAPPFHLYFGGAHALEWGDHSLMGAADRRRKGTARGL